jgi:ribulose kinase
VHQLAAERKAPFLSHLTRHYHLYPDLHGNRSPLADPRMRGMLTGLALDATTTDLALRYLATCEAIALQTRQIMDAMNDRGHAITSIFMSGGLVKNAILMQLLADICHVPVQLPFSHSASVVLGSAMLGRAAAEEAAVGVIATQAEAEKRSHGMKDRLWAIMVPRAT